MNQNRFYVDSYQRRDLITIVFDNLFKPGFLMKTARMTFMKHDTCNKLYISLYFCTSSQDVVYCRKFSIGWPNSSTTSEATRVLKNVILSNRGDHGIILSDANHIRPFRQTGATKITCRICGNSQNSFLDWLRYCLQQCVEQMFELRLMFTAWFRNCTTQIYCPWYSSVRKRK